MHLKRISLPLASALLTATLVTALFSSFGCRKEAAITSAPTAAAGPAFIGVTGSDLKSLVAKSGAKVTIVNLWATWCEPCREEMPELLQFAKAHEADVKLILVSGDNETDAPKAQEFLKLVGAPAPIYRLTQEADDFRKAFEPTWGATLPTTFIFDSKGRQTTFWVGKTNLKELESKVKPLLAPGLASPGKI